MRIAYFTTFFPSKNIHDTQLYGSARSMASLIKYIALRGHETYVFTSSENSKNIQEIDGGVKIFRYRITLRYLSTIFVSKLFLNPEKIDVDIIHINFDIPPNPFAGLWYAKKKPLVVTYRGDWDSSYGSFFRRFGLRLINAIFVKRLLNRADCIISPSKFFIMRSVILSKYIEKVTVIPNGINVKEFQIPQSKFECRIKLGLPQNCKIILFMGSLYPHKGPDILIKSMRMVVDKIPDALLVMGGEGILKQQLIKIVAEQNLEDKILFRGFIHDTEKAFYYNAADLFVLPSLVESFGNVNLEAMACGLPIVASDVGGIPDLIKPDVNGILVKPDDSLVLSSAIIDILSSNEKRDAMGKNGRKIVNDFSWEKIADLTEKKYFEIIRRCKS